MSTFKQEDFIRLKCASMVTLFSGDHLEYFRNISVQYLCVLILSLTELHDPLSVLNCNVFWSLLSSQC